MTNKLTDKLAATLMAKIVYFDLEARRSLPLTPDLRERISTKLIKNGNTQGD